MSEESVKVKDLVAELGVQRQELLQMLRDLGIPAKNQQSLISAEEAMRVREHYSAAPSVNVTTKTPSKGDVIVRRRRNRDEGADASMQGAAKSGREPEREPQPSESEEDRSKTVSDAPDAVNAREAASAANIAGEEEKAAKENAKGATAKPRPQKNKPRPKPVAATARVISRPEDIAAKPAEAEPENEAPVACATENAARETPLEQPPVSEVKTEPVPAAEAVEDASARKRLAAPDATAVPDADDIAASRAQVQSVMQAAPSAPLKEQGDEEPRSDGRRQGREEGGERPERPARNKKRREETPAPQVRIISRPDPAPVAPEPAPRAGAPAGTPARPVERMFMPSMPARSFDGPVDRDGKKKAPRPKGGRRTVDFHQEMLGDDDMDAGFRLGDVGETWQTPRPSGARRPKRRQREQKAQTNTQPIKAAKRKVRMEEVIRVADFAHQMGVKGAEVVKVLFGLGVMATINQSLDLDTATVVASEFGYVVERVGFSETDYLAETTVDTPEMLKPRPPVVTIMGHVDHGKTSLLDAIRKSSVVSGEAGGITQHIGAYLVSTKRGDIVFLDTPGHEAFTAMRARGAQVTDIVILVVAADDGVMEQTKEAINHSKAAGVPIMVAVNKIDKPEANPERVMRELADYGLVSEDWGGDTVFAQVSAKTRVGLDDLLELIALQAEILELKANPDKPARGHIVEAKLDKGRGPVGTVLIQEGTLKLGDPFVCGTFSGRVRAMFNDQGKKVREAGPSMPVEVQGFEGVPVAGEEFVAVADEKVARRIADTRAMKQREKELARETKVTLETFLSRGADDQEAQTLNLVVKADVQGSLEAIVEALNKQSTDKVRIQVIHGGTGAISESDIMLAAASSAIVIGFNVRPTAKVKEVAEQENVDIRFYNIIYNLVDEIRSAMAGMLAPVSKEMYLGQAEVRQPFSVPKVGTIAGSYVVDGKITRNAGARLLRDSVVIYTGKISSLKRFKEDAREVAKGYECGIGLENYNDIKAGDIIEAFELVEEAATL